MLFCIFMSHFFVYITFLSGTFFIFSHFHKQFHKLFRQNASVMSHNIGPYQKDIPFLSSLQSHIQQWVCIAFLIQFCPFICIKSHMLIKSYCLWILLIYSELLHSIVIYSVHKKLFSDSFSSLITINKKHFQSVIFYSHKCNNFPEPIFCNNQMFYTILLHTIKY